MKIRLKEETSKEPQEEYEETARPQRTLMDIQNLETFLPRFKFPEHEETYKEFLKGKINVEELLMVMTPIGTSSPNGKVVMTDALLGLWKKLSPGVRRRDLELCTSLLISLRELLWYISPHHSKLKEKNCQIPEVLLKLCDLNNPKRHAHKAPNISQHILLSLVEGVHMHFDKSFTARTKFKAIHSLVENSLTACVKYSDYLIQNNTLQVNCQYNEEEPNYEKKISELPFLTSLSTYKLQRERNAIEQVLTDLESKDFYEPVSVDYYFLERRSYGYLFYKNLKSFGIPLGNTILFAQYYTGSKGNKYFIWKEDPTSENKLTERQRTIEQVTRMLPKYFSRSHKRKIRYLTEQVMFDKISPAQFRFIYQEITGDETVPDNKKLAEYDERIRLIIKHADTSLCRDLRINNTRKEKFQKFWDIAKEKISEMTAVDDRRHTQGSTLTGEVVVNMAIAISARDLYNQCKESAFSENLTDADIPSFSWFKFQFWPKDCTTHSALNYTGRFPVKYMMQQRMIRKSHDDEHYANAIYKYVREYAVSLRDKAIFICTDDKHKISVGEPNFPLSALPRGKRVLVGNNEAYQVGDHDFSTISLIPTVILFNDIPTDVNESWYRGRPCVLLKISATCPSSALRNATEISKIILRKYGSIENVPPVLFVYTDGGPEHRTTFLSVKIALITLQRYLNLDQVVAVRTAPGHSFRNPAEKINCVLNLALYGIGCMRHTSSDLEFEEKLHRCSGLSDVRDLLNRNPEKNITLLHESCKPCVNLINDTFSRLTLKDKTFQVFDPASQHEIDRLFESVNLDNALKPLDTMAELKNRPKLAQYLKHCCKERTYFFSAKKCGNLECEICVAPRLTPDDFNRLQHLPDPMPSSDDVHYKTYEEVFGADTDEKAMPSLKTTKDRGHKIPFNPTKQHATNTNLFVECAECSKPRVVYAAKKISDGERKSFKLAMSDMLYTCGASLHEFKNTNDENDKRYTILEKVFVRTNNSCTKPVEALYYTVNYPDCCCHCGSKRRLIKSTNEYSICSPCKVVLKKLPVSKRKRKLLDSNSL